MASLAPLCLGLYVKDSTNPDVSHRPVSVFHFERPDYEKMRAIIYRYFRVEDSRDQTLFRSIFSSDPYWDSFQFQKRREVSPLDDIGETIDVSTIITRWNRQNYPLDLPEKLDISESKPHRKIHVTTKTLRERHEYDLDFKALTQGEQDMTVVSLYHSDTFSEVWQVNQDERSYRRLQVIDTGSDGNRRDIPIVIQESGFRLR